jgi:biopolymer transport protein ExbD
MRLNRSRLKPVKETQMVSLADIAFLIIFFFMLTSNFMRDKLAIDLPKLPETTKTDTPISVAMDKDRQIYLNGQSVGGIDALQTELKGMLAGKSDGEVRFRCDRSLTFKDYRPIYQAISDAGGVIAIMHDVR